MSFLFFVDESGHDHREAPYEVRSAVAVHDSRVWDLILALKRVEGEYFGTAYSGDGRELKAKRLLKRKTFRLAAQMDAFAPDERRALAREAFENGDCATRASLTALAQAKLAFCERALRICSDHGVAYFASIVHPEAPRAAGTGLRKDYSYLFQRIYYFLEQHEPSERGLLVMDEMDRVEAGQLMSQMSAYFQSTAFGRARCRRIVPQPLFVPSDLTTGVQVADLVAYVINWNVRLPGMTAPTRRELDPLGDHLRAAHRQYRVRGLGYPASSFVYLRDLRTRSEKDLESREGRVTMAPPRLVS
jgi:Protein of unknown function (DUF3800)